MTRTTLLITALLCFTSLVSTASDYPGAGNYYSGGSSSTSGPANYPGAGSYYPGGSGGAPDLSGISSSYPGAGSSNYPGATGSADNSGASSSYPGATGPSYSPGAGSSYPGAGGNYPGAGGSYPGATGSGFNPGAGGSYPGATGPVYTPGANAPGQTISCPFALSGANRAFDQLVANLKKQAPQWAAYSDFDAVNEVSYFLKTTCNTTQLQLVRAGPPGKNKTQEKACNDLQAMLENVLEENNAADYRGGFEGALDTAKKGLELGKLLGDNCQFKVVQLNDTNTTNATNTTVNPKLAPGTVVPVPSQGNKDTPVKSVKTSFRVVPVSAHNVGLGEEEESFVDNGEWDTEDFLSVVDDLKMWGYF